MDLRDVYERAEHTTPAPLTPGEVSLYSRIPKSCVEMLIGDGLLRVTKTANGDRIPFSIFEAFVLENARERIDEAREHFSYVAAALDAGAIVEKGLDDFGFTIYEDICNTAT